MASTTMTFDDSRARDELGYTSRTPEWALYDSARWFVERGYVSADRVHRIRWKRPEGDGGRT